MPKPPTKAQIQAENDKLKQELALAKKKFLESDADHRETLAELDDVANALISERGRNEELSIGLSNLEEDLQDAKDRLSESNRTTDEVREELRQTRDEITQFQNTLSAGISAEPVGEMKAYTKYSYFVEKTCGLGRNGKRVLHGGVAAGATYGVGHYLGTEVIVNNPMTSMAIAAGAGFVGTAILDSVLLDKEEILKMRMAELEEMTTTEQLTLQASVIAARMAE